MRRTILALLPLLLTACPKGDDTGADDTGTPTDRFSQFINVTEEFSADLSCYTPGSDWIAQEVDATAVADWPAAGFVMDFQDDVGVADVTLEVWNDDLVDSSPDDTTTSSSDGSVSLGLPSCTPVTYRTSTDPTLGRTKDTYEAHSVYGVPGTGTIDTEFNSVSSATYVLIASLLGVNLSEDESIIAGTAFDCAEEPVEALQVVVVDAAGNIPEDLVVRYFVEEWPVQDQPWTSADGLWVAMHVPPGDWTVQAWGLQGGEHVLLGATTLTTFADSINISNIYAGIGDGTKYPGSCLVAR